jgi:GPH family glycoside/pentoside/hexuronide:cation symporter
VHVDDWLSGLIGYDLINASTVFPVYLTLLGIIFFTSFTFWSMPYYGMQLELTPNYDERTRLTAWMTVFGKLSSLIGSWILALVILVGSLALGDPKVFEGKPEFFQNFLSSIQPWLASVTNTTPDEKPIVVGMRVVCWIVSLCFIFFGMMPALFVKERYYKAEVAKKQARDPFWQSVRESATCKPLWSLILISFFLVLGSSSVGSLGQYLNFYYVFDGDLGKAAVVGGLKGSVIVVAGIASIPLFTWLGEKFDKRSVVMTMLGCSMIGHLLNYFLMTPEHPYWQLIPGVFESCAIAAVWLFIPSMKADVADYDELHTKRRREGSINSFFSWFIKASLTASVGIGGYVLQTSGFQASLERQPHDVLMRMFHLYLFLPLGIWAIAMVAAWFYPITRSRSNQIRSELETRRGAM